MPMELIPNLRHFADILFKVNAKTFGREEHSAHQHQIFSESANRFNHMYVPINLLQKYVFLPNYYKK